MTGLLQDLMHDRADSLDAPDLDLASIMSVGELRVRRRRTARAGVVAATAAAAMVVATLLPGGDSAGRDDLVADGTDSAPVALSWISGSTLHRAGQADRDLGTEVRAWVWAGDAVVFTDTARRVHVWEDGAVRTVGEVVPGAPDDAELVADATSVAWIDVERDLTVYDLTSDGPWSAELEQSSGTPARVTALDGARVYAVDDRGVVAWSAGPEGRTEVLDADSEEVVFDAENGDTLVQRSGSREARVSGPGRDVTLTVDTVANLSPSGAFVMAESNDEGVMLDTATGREIELATGHAWSLPYQWLDDETVAVLSFDGLDQPRPSAYLQTCEMATGGCTSPGTGISAEHGSFQLPIGVHFSH